LLQHRQDLAAIAAGPDLVAATFEQIHEHLLYGPVVIHDED
jgi:hypothetical protein